MLNTKSRRAVCARNSPTRVVEYQEEPKKLGSDVERAGGAQKLGPRCVVSREVLNVKTVDSSAKYNAT